MPTGVPLSSQQQDIVRAVIMEGKTDKEAMLVSGVSRSAISHIRAKLRSSGASIPAPSTPSTSAAAAVAPKTNGNGHHRPTLLEKAKAFRNGKATALVGAANPKLERVRKYVAQGLRPIDISRKMGVTDATIHYYLKRLNGVKTKPTKHLTQAASNGSGSNPQRQARIQRYMEKGWTSGEIAEKLEIAEGTASYYMSKIKKLGNTRAKVGRPGQSTSKVAFYVNKGWKVPQIAEKLGITKQSAYYHVSKLKQPQGTQESTDDGNSNAFSKDIRIGIAFAEAERFINAVGERLAIPPTILRRRLSELLGHSPIR